MSRPQKTFGDAAFEAADQTAATLGLIAVGFILMCGLGAASMVLSTGADELNELAAARRAAHAEMSTLQNPVIGPLAQAPRTGRR